MAVITIDNKQYEVDQHKNLLETAISLGLDVPYFCWHPGLGSVGSCRLCAVQQMSDENDTTGRTVMACMTPCKDASRFSVAHPIAKDFRASVVEWLMTNHPHDCPVCDEGGECHLQDMTQMSGHNYRNYRFQKRTYQNQNLGPFINHEMNRCISCYRCVRYYKDVAGGTDLGAFKSSGKVYFGRFSEGDLSSEFSGNLVEVCPTGVFTDKTYHQHYVRKWDLSTSPSLCQLCGVGCNIAIGERSGILRRVQNRYHNDINGFFICDRGRFGHDYANSDRRLKKYWLKTHGTLKEVGSDVALSTIKDVIAKSFNVIGIGSGQASLEANFMLKRLVGENNFYDATLSHERSAINEAIFTLDEGLTEPATLKHIREADAVLIIGEDLTNTAPIMALAIRQAAVAFKQRKSKAELNIDTWNDAAVRDYARGDLLPVLSINAQASGLDNICQQKVLVHPWQMGPILNALEDALNDKTISVSLPPETMAFINSAKSLLSAAKNPVIIAGTSLGDADLIKSAKNISWALSRVNEARLSLVVPESNTVGLKLLKPRDLLKTPYVTQKEPVDVAIVLEQDLKWRIGSKAFSALCQNIKYLIVLDNLDHDILNIADAVIPTLTFLESSGSFISSEGRLQRFFGAAAPDHIKSSFHILAILSGLEKSMASIDDAIPALANELKIDEQTFNKLYEHQFRILGQKIPRQSSEASGRTALKAYINIHEQKPPSDPDSPLSYSMEGARKKIPLPLISSSWAPKWNSVQASFKTILSPEAQVQDAFGGVRLFGKKETSAPKTHASPPKKAQEAPHFYVVPRHNIFASFSDARFSKSLSSRMPKVEAEISPSDASKLGFVDFAPIVIETEHGKFSILAKTKEEVPAGVMLLPFGLVDASLFFTNCFCRVVSKEQA